MNQSKRNEITQTILNEMNQAIEALKDKAEKYIKALAAIPDSFTGDIMFNGTYIVVESTDKNLFLEIARNLNSKVQKSTDTYSHTGRLLINNVIRSVDVPLPSTCQFKAVEKTYTVMEPIGDCGSWFDTKC